MAELLLEARNIDLSFGIRRVLNIERLELFDGDKIGLVGENGAGKTTLLKILSGEMNPDSGHIRRLREAGMIRQMGETDAEMDSVIAGKFAVRENSAFLSGGEKTRRRIAGAISKNTQILFADEPTVDLDEAGVLSLEKMLSEFKGALILISHDRALLDSVCTSIWELEDGKITVIPGNYSAYREIRAERLEREKTEYDQYRAEEKRIKKLIQQEYEHAQQKQHLPGRMGNSEARLHKREVTNVQAAIHKVRKGYESRLGRLDEKKRPREDVNIRMALGEASPITSKTAVQARGAYARFGARTLFEFSSFVIPVGSRTALLGENGAGKTTLIRQILSKSPFIKISPGVVMGYFGQNHTDVLDEEKTALENARAESDKDESAARTVLAGLNMPGDNVFKKVKVLSGGERAKVALARLLLSNANFLILDEPTNHLDIFSLEALENLLSAYTGTLLFVSHDRDFVKNVATRLLKIENKRIITFEGTISEYEEAIEKRKRGKEKEEAMLHLTSLEMRLADIAARLSAPRKGDSPEKLNEEYLEVAEMIRTQKRKMESMN